MSEIVVRAFTAADRKQVETIFFESSARQDFTDQAEKQHFLRKYLGLYLEQYPDYAFVAAMGADILGYIVGMPVTEGEELFELQPHLASFTACYQDYPAHLHMNCHHRSRGQGIGQRLYEKMEETFRAQGIKGLHIMTAPAARNRQFYARLGLDFTLEVEFNHSPILFMGKRMSAQGD
jgi:GNAT superfamily N-acetyltransferase